eukprot:4257138-Amphidinium_carterae.1
MAVHTAQDLDELWGLCCSFSVQALDLPVGSRGSLASAKQQATVAELTLHVQAAPWTQIL